VNQKSYAHAKRADIVTRETSASNRNGISHCDGGMPAPGDTHRTTGSQPARWQCPRRGQGRHAANVDSERPAAIPARAQQKAACQSADHERNAHGGGDQANRTTGCPAGSYDSAWPYCHGVPANRRKTVKNKALKLVSQAFAGASTIAKVAKLHHFGRRRAKKVALKRIIIVYHYVTSLFLLNNTTQNNLRNMYYGTIPGDFLVATTQQA
jgi:hypothetical protein